MTHAFMFVIAQALAGSVAPDGIDREQLVRLIESARESVGDLTLEYEGSFEYMQPSDRGLHHPDRKVGVMQLFSGTFTRRSDGAIRVEVYREDTKGKSNHHAIRTVLAGKADRREDDQQHSTALITKGVATGQELPTGFSYARIDLRDVVVAFARADLPYRYDGDADVSGRRCIVVRFAYKSGPTGPENFDLCEIFWIDLERGAHVLKHERRHLNNLIELTTDIKLHEFEAPSGLKFWFPISGRAEGHMTINPNLPDSPRVYTAEPVFIERYDMINATLRMEQGLKDEYFSVKAKPGDIISDELKNARYEHGQYLVRSKNERAKRVTDVEIQQSLDKMLGDSEVLARELKASSPARNGPGWVDILPWAVALLACVTLGGYLIHRRFAA